MKRFAALGILGLVLIILFNAPAAQADVGGAVPAPGLCEYPGVCGSGMIMNAYYYWSDFPTEINGAHWHCQWGGASIDAAAGISIMMFTAGISGHIGALNGTCTWRCPDMSLAEPPNPPGAWKDPIRPSKCKTVGPDPNAPPAEVAAPVADPIPPPAPIPPPILPAVTDPACPNPDATVNKACGAG
jgi:hypothetical protein